MGWFSYNIILFFNIKKVDWIDVEVTHQENLNPTHLLMDK
jgi:hypothetical protein